MKQPSKYFDSIRISGNKRARPEAKAEPVGAPCEWHKGCTRPGAHKAPKGRGREGEYFLFCIEHVRQYNATYNYFDGMSDSEVEDFRRDSLTGHRPTRKLGANASTSAPTADGATDGPTSSATAGAPEPSGSAARFKDPHAFFAERARAAREEAKSARRKLKPLEKKSLQALNLPDTAGKDEIKARYKELVKQHHPDTNGGDPRSADKLREVIQAYNLLKSAGMA